MDIASSRAVLEDDRTWRQDEIRFLRNQLANLEREDEKSKYRRALVPMLYAHYEGFCKVALQHYVKVVNAAGIACEDASAAIIAASWELIFRRLANPKQKCDVFRDALPDDSKLWAALQRCGGGTWGGCVYDVDSIVKLLSAGERSEETRR